MAAQTPRPTILVAPSRATVGSNCILLVRMPATPTEERTLGARALWISLPTVNERDAIRTANAALNQFDQRAGTSPTERARSIIANLRKNLGETVEVCIVGMSQREAWVATTGAAGVAALVLRETRRVTIELPRGAPGGNSASATRQGVTVGRIPLSEGDRIALAATPEEASGLLRRTTERATEVRVTGLVLVLQAPAVPLTPRAERVVDTLFSIPADNVAQAKAKARARWEEGNVERGEQIAATVPPKPTGDPWRSDGGTEPYKPIDRAAQEVIASRRGGIRVSAPPRGAEPREVRPSRERRTHEVARNAAKARAERSPGAEPRTERSWSERAVSAPTPIQRGVARFVLGIERRFPQFATKEIPPTLNPENPTKRGSAAEEGARGRRLAASALLATLIVAGVGGVAAVYLNQTNPNLDAAAAGRSAMTEAQRAVDEALSPTANLLVNDPEHARKLLIVATENLKKAELGGTPAADIAALRSQMTPALNKLFFLTETTAVNVFDFSKASVPITITAITQGPDGYSYIIDQHSGAVYRVDPTATPNPRATVVFQPGYDLYETRTGRAQAITSSGPDLVIFDTSSNLWRWRPADNTGRGTLVKLRIRDGELWGSDVTIISGFAADEGTGLYRLYAVDPSARQILRYTPAPDGTGYPAPPTGYLTSPMALTSVQAMAIDGDLYLSQDGSLRRYVGGAADDWAPADPGDSALRSAPNISLIFSVGASRTGVIYAWDKENQRLLAYTKGASGSVIAQYRLVAADGPVSNIAGGYVALAADGGAPTFIWAEGARIRSAVLGAEVVPGGEPSAAPTAAPIIELPSTKP
jgi:hypothetical protein